MSHTPGPWVIDPAYPSEVQTADLKTVSSCWHEYADGLTIKVTGILPCSIEESAANARLIAAAPELLEALAQCQKALAMMITPTQIDQTSTLQAFAIATEAEAKARGAISKAEGRQ